MSEVYTEKDLEDRDTLIKVVMTLANQLTFIIASLKYQDYKISHLATMVTELLDDLKTENKIDTAPTRGVG